QSQVDNLGPNDNLADPWVVCAAKPAKFAFVAHSNVFVPGGFQESELVTCPAGTVLLGGGTGSTNTPFGLDINSAYPLDDHDWLVDMNNDTGVNERFDVTAQCGKQPSNYSIQKSAPVDNPPGTESFATATCPAPSVPIAGGVFSSSGRTNVDARNSFPVPGS